MNNDTTYTVKRLDDKNLADIEKLHIAVYGRRPASGFFKKKYDTGFTGLNYVGYLAYNQNKVCIGYYGVLPCFIRFGGEIILAAQSGDTMTHPKFRFKGLFVELSIMAFKLCKDSGIKLLFGFPNQNSVHGAINKLGWQSAGQMDCFIIPSGAALWTRVLKKMSVFKKPFSLYQKSILKNLTLPQQGINNSVFEDGFAGVYRDKHFRNYKAYTPNYTLKISKSTVWLKLNQELLIGDIELAANDFDAVMHQLKKLAAKLGAKEIHFHTSHSTTLHKLFAERFTATPSFLALFQDFEGDTDLLNIKFTAADIDTF